MNARVLITGCSSGLGMHAAVGLAAAGFKVIATMRDVSKRAALDQALQSRGVSAHVLALDVTSLESVIKAFADIKQHHGGLDVLINNAGVTRQGFLEHMPDDQFFDLFQTNVFGVIRVTRAALPLLREGAAPRVINISSLAGIAGYPGGTAYSASKWVVEGFTESLYYELLPLGIRVCVIEPGGYKTEIYQSNSNHLKVPRGSVYESMDKALAETYGRVERTRRLCRGFAKVDAERKPTAAYTDELRCSACSWPAKDIAVSFIQLAVLEYHLEANGGATEANDPREKSG